MERRAEVARLLHHVLISALVRFGNERRAVFDSASAYTSFVEVEL
jgi:hypothetical protein